MTYTISGITDYKSKDIDMSWYRSYDSDIQEITQYINSIDFVSKSEPNYWYRVFHKSIIWRGRRVIGSLAGYNRIKTKRLFRNGG